MTTTTAGYISGKMRHELKAGLHTVMGDVSADEGGEDSGLSPHDLLALSLAACTSMTLRMYAKRKGWHLENAQTTVEVTVSAEKTLFKRIIHLIGALDLAQSEQLLKIADRCPIHKILVGKIEIVSELSGVL